MSLPSWKGGLARTGGFYQDSDWYSANLHRKMPLVPKMMEELVAALPPLGDAKVLDLLSGAGQATEAVLTAYPRARVTVLERCEERVERCKAALARRDPPAGLDSVYQQEVDLFSPNATPLPGGPYSMVVASLALHTLVGHQGQTEEQIRDRYRAVFRAIHEVLLPGGHLLIADHVGVWGLYSQLRLMEEVGFMDLDVSWRQEAFFVAGGRRKEVTPQVTPKSP